MRLHRYYGLLRPCVPPRYSHPRGSSTWVSPLPSERQVPVFHTKAWFTFTPLLCRMPPRQYAGFPWTYPGVVYASSFDIVFLFSTPHQWFACARLPEPHLTQSSAGPFPTTLTTRALDPCSLRRFGACSCKPTPRGLPSSPVQPRGARSPTNVGPKISLVVNDYW